MMLSPGMRFGAYEIARHLGSGGMGEVYLSTDAALERDVALKVLPESFSQDAGRVARFEQEAKTLAALNHANIAQIYGLESDGGDTALVMELIEGPTLAERIERGPIPTDEALDIALQIADALAAAHERGIVHRDLKPANVKLKPDGTVKVLDFGIARALATDAESSGARTPSLTTPAMTEAGVILGTAAYMSPEQARGKLVDRRADIWSFACVLYEMLTGQPAFGGEDVQITLARVLTERPDLDALPAAVSPAVRRTLELCLEKDARKRIADIGDVRLGLEGRFDLGASRGAAEAGAPPIWQRPAPAYAIALLALAALAAVAYFGEQRPVGDVAVRDPIHFVLQPPNRASYAYGVEAVNLAISPDGRRIAFVASSGGVRRVWLQSFDGESPQALAGTEGAYSPFWSPDGNRLAFFTDTELKAFRLGTGTTDLICTCATYGFSAAAWSPGGTILFTVFPRAFGSDPSALGALYRISADGGEPVRIGGDGRSPLIVPRWPVFLPDGERFLLLANLRGDDPETEPSGYHLFLGDLGDDSIVPLFPFESRVEIAGGHLIYVQQGILLARAFDFATRRFSSEAVPIGTNVQQFAGSGWAPFTVSRTGAAAYIASSGLSELVWYDREGTSLGTVGEPEPYWSLALSPEGTRVAVEIAEDTAESDIWIHDLSRDTRTRFTTLPGFESTPVWSPDGRRVVFSKHGGINSGLMIQSLDRGEATPAGSPRGQFEWPLDWNAERNLVVFERSDDIWLLPMDASATATARTETAFSETSAALSPNGDWLAYSSNETGRSEIYLARVDGSAGAELVSGAGGSLPRWRTDGSELYFISSDGGVMAVPVAIDAGVPMPGVPETLFSLESLGGQFDFDVTADGERFLVIRTEPPEMHVEIGWTARLPTD
jgi:dipeptidyl aminopeptidase/acylaminoacyl peptidase